MCNKPLASQHILDTQTGALKQAIFLLYSWGFWWSFLLVAVFSCYGHKVWAANLQQLAEGYGTEMFSLISHNQEMCALPTL